MNDKDIARGIDLRNHETQDWRSVHQGMWAKIKAYIDAHSGGASTFLALTDTPASYSGAGGYTVKVNSGATGLEFVAGGGGVASFVDLDDVPTSYTSQGYKLVRVNTGETALEFATLQGTTNQVTVTPGSGVVTLATPQDIATTSLVQFGGVTIERTPSNPYLDMRDNSGASRKHLVITLDLTNSKATLDVLQEAVGYWPIEIGTSKMTVQGPVQVNHTVTQGATSLKIRRTDNTNVPNGTILWTGSDDVLRLGLGTYYNISESGLEFLFYDSTFILTKFYMSPAGNLGIGTNTFGSSATRTLAVATGTAPSTSPADAIQFYSSDWAAGNAVPTFRTENGTVVYLMQNLATTSAVQFSSLTLTAAPALILSGSMRSIAQAADDSGIYYCGGTAFNKGASLQMYGEDHATLPGSLYFAMGSSDTSPDSRTEFGYRDAGTYKARVWITRLGQLNVTGVYQGSENAYNGEVILGNTASYQARISYTAATNTTWNFDSTYDNAGAVMLFRFRTAGTPVTTLYLTGAGNVGIGQTTFGTSAARVLAFALATAPSTSPVDAFQMYAYDVAGGDACPHFRTEDGVTVILNQNVGRNAAPQFSGVVMMELGTPPGTPASGLGRLYAMDDGFVYYINDGGTSYNLTLGSAHNLLSATHSDTTAASVVRGDIIIGDATPKWVRLAKGTSGYFLKAGASDVAWAQITAADAGAVPTSRNVSTTSPLAGGGDLSADRTLTVGGLSSIGTSNYLVGVNAGASAWEYKNITGTSNRVTVTHGVGTITLNGPQDIHTTATPQFTGLGLGTAWTDSKKLVMTGSVDPATDATCYGLQIYSLSLTPGTSYDAYLISAAGTVVAGTGETLGSAFGIAQSGMTKSGSGTINVAYGVYSSSPALATTNWNFYASGAAGSYFGGFTRHASYIEVAEISAPGTPSSGFGRLYGASDGKLYYVNDAGTTVDLTLGGSASTHVILDSTIHTDTLTGTVTRGDLIYGNSTPKWARLALGTNGYFLKSNGTDVAWAAHGLTASDVGAVPTSRTISTTTPLAGGGDLTTNRTFTVGGLSAWGSANQLVGMNNGATAWEYKTLSGTTDQVSVAHAANSITLSTPQSINTTSSPQFARLGLGVAANTAYGIYSGGTMGGSANYKGHYMNRTFTLSSAGTYVDGIHVAITIDTTASNYSLTSAYGVRVGTMAKSGSGTITSAYGIYIDTQNIGGTDNYGLYSVTQCRFAGGLLSDGLISALTGGINTSSFVQYQHTTTPTTPTTSIRVYAKNDHILYYVSSNGTEQAVCPQSRSISTTSPLTGGGDLTANRTIALAGLTGLGTANQLLGMNNGATAYEYKTIQGTTNQVTVTHAANSITLSTPQDLHTGAGPTFDHVHYANYLEGTELASSPGTPSSGYGRIYVKNDGTLHFVNDAGTDTALGAGGTGAKTKSQAFTGDGTWTQPTGVTLVWVTAIGAGGGGEAGATSSRGGGGGGCGAAYYRFPVVVSGNVTVTIGTAGTAGSGSSGANGGSGGNTTFGSLLTAHGGIGGGIAGGGYGGAGGGEVDFGASQSTAGGTGNSPTIRGAFYIAGAGGGGGQTGTGTGGTGGRMTRYAGGPGGASTYGGGGGGSSLFGQGGTGGTSGVAGTAGATNSGAGGGGGWGGATYTAGGAGAAGYCLVEWIE